MTAVMTCHKSSILQSEKSANTHSLLHNPVPENAHSIHFIFKECFDKSDEMNFPERTHFYCNDSGATLFVRQTQASLGILLILFLDLLISPIQLRSFIQNFKNRKPQKSDHQCTVLYSKYKTYFFPMFREPQSSLS